MRWTDAGDPLLSQTSYCRTFQCPVPQVRIKTLIVILSEAKDLCILFALPTRLKGVIMAAGCYAANFRDTTLARMAKALLGKHQVFRANQRLAFAQDQGAFDGILEFADVSVPRLDF